MASLYRAGSEPNLLDLMDGLWFGSSLTLQPSLIPNGYTESEDNSLHGGVVHNGNLWVKGIYASTLGDAITEQGDTYQPSLSHRTSSSPASATPSSHGSTPHGGRSTNPSPDEAPPAPTSSTWRSSPSLHIPISPTKPLIAPTPAPQQVSSAELSPALGTWAERQFKLPLPSQPKQQDRNPFAQPSAHSKVLEDSATQPSLGAAAAPVVIPSGAQPSAAAVSGVTAAFERAAARDEAAFRPSTDSEDEGHQDAAWRWRFQRRWRAEQVREIDPDKASATDRVDQAFAYLNACGEGWHRHLARTASTDAGSRALASTLAGTLDCNTLLIQEEPSFEGTHRLRTLSSMMSDDYGLAGGAGGTVRNATREVAAAGRQVQQLLRQQMSIERQVDARWSALEQQEGGGQWVGSFLAPVQVDEWGVFKFLLMRVAEARQQRQMLLVRGRNGCSEGATVEAVRREVSQVCAQHGVPAEHVEVLGGGVMEWRRDRDRYLQVHSGFVSGAGSASGMSVAGLLNLAAAMSKQALPMHYKVALGSKVL